MRRAPESDVATLDDILHALYWERYRSLFMDGPRLIVVLAVTGEKPSHARAMPPFVANNRASHGGIGTPA